MTATLVGNHPLFHAPTVFASYSATYFSKASTGRPVWPKSRYSHLHPNRKVKEIPVEWRYKSYHDTFVIP